MNVERNDDASLASSIERACGWSRSGREVARRFEVAHGLIARIGDDVVGSATVAVYGDALAWIGGMAVLPAWRRKGVGRALLDACITHARARGVQVIGLDANEEGRPLYEAAGFQAVGRSVKWERQRPLPLPLPLPSPLPSPSCAVHPVSLSEAMEIRDFDLPRFGAPRLPSLLSTLHDFPWTCFMARDRRAGDVAGYALAWERGIGPVVADDAEAARALVAACLAAGAPEAALVPDDARAQEVFRTHGFVPTDRACTRMLLGGGAMPGRAASVFALGTWALG